MAQLQVTQTKSAIGGKQNQRNTLRTLGLGKIGRVTVREDNAQVRGMIQVVNHLVKVEEVD
ncbi:50S ribosomal protein L30 [Litorihabitans aurantiacus]|uniref:Large ribosomal subunit protein uL30 n=1 Tax=Litorihabitans aurantiacus TaxID=1930061 RepID=A0AA37XF67_9MICO|nr:50S ribosomal protein L30 [Litorihabitans aurantiacus]GMA32278.1 50S ribosomal protein L30 [Litorihabitans aurantiacus]